MQVAVADYCGQPTSEICVAGKGYQASASEGTSYASTSTMVQGPRGRDGSFASRARSRPWERDVQRETPTNPGTRAGVRFSRGTGRSGGHNVSRSQRAELGGRQLHASRPSWREASTRTRHVPSSFPGTRGSRGSQGDYGLLQDFWKAIRADQHFVVGRVGSL